MQSYYITETDSQQKELDMSNMTMHKSGFKFSRAEMLLMMIHLAKCNPLTTDALDSIKLKNDRF